MSIPSTNTSHFLINSFFHVTSETLWSFLLQTGGNIKFRPHPVGHPDTMLGSHHSFSCFYFTHNVQFAHVLRFQSCSCFKIISSCPSLLSGHLLSVSESSSGSVSHFTPLFFQLTHWGIHESFWKSLQSNSQSTSLYYLTGVHFL